MSALPAYDRPQRVAGRRTEPTRVSLQRPVAAPAPAGRAPFVALILFVIGAGLIALLVLNTAIAADSFTERSLSQQIAQLRLQEQELQQEIGAAQAPAALARAAVEQGMLPAGPPGFLIVHPDGTTQVVGEAKPATRPPPPARRN